MKKCCVHVGWTVNWRTSHPAQEPCPDSGALVAPAVASRIDYSDGSRMLMR